MLYLSAICWMVVLMHSLTFTTAFTFSNELSIRAISSPSPTRHYFSSMQHSQTIFLSSYDRILDHQTYQQHSRYTPQLLISRKINRAAKKTSLNLTLSQGGEIIRSIAGILLATKISMNGYKTKKSLSKSGAIAAFAVASISLICSLRSGMTLLLFYMTSSRLTRLGREIKQKLDDDDKAGVGKRDATQVLSCSAVGVICAVIRRIYVGLDSPLNLLHHADLASLGNRLTLAYVAFFACCAGDTWASELGVLSKTPPRMITKPWKIAVPGTNGAVSMVGLLASAGGGLTMGLIHGFFLPGLWLCLAGRGGADQWIVLGKEIAALAAVGFACGLGGSLLDSLLGATVQATYYDPEKKKICKKPTDKTERIGGVFAILSNEMVNVVSTTATALFAALWAKPLLSWVTAI